MPPDPGTTQGAVLPAANLQNLFQALARRGYTLVGPTLRDGAIIYNEISSPEDLPVGWTDEQDGGTYRVRRRGDGACFGYVVGPHSWKKYLFSSSLRLWRANRSGNRFDVHADSPDARRYAFIGVRPCELHAIAIQDKVFLQGASADPTYRARREQIFVVAVNCSQAGRTCFCASMRTGPRATFGYDLALTEVLEGQDHYFVVEVRSEAGAQILRDIPCREASQAEADAAARVVARAAAQMGRTMDTTNIKELLYRNSEHPRWDDVAGRCLTCGNCTLVCPTCFCSTVEDLTNVTGEHAERWRKWDSCFTLDFSHLHGGSVRTTAKGRYRQWMTHKLASWIDQFGTSGCVGCGRCITWCPVGIDITEEVRAIRDTDSVRGQPPLSKKEVADEGH